MPYLEFNQYFAKQHGINVFKPHEMQWSLDQFLERMVDTRDEAESRVERMMDRSYENVSRFINKVEEMADSEKQNEKTESLKQQLRELNQGLQENEESAQSEKTKIF